uniref:SH3 domain and tetratricopeptide repeat-containing protein 1-like isoform X2 n=1 Tax=Camelus bactrianus TaxID=9837 RepID=A0A9W3HLA2_CAMBA|nr:SH3 domain and tetratricopeptide repeat-containing protein 1-like isoform X2 [Camelus bactrianus]
MPSSTVHVGVIGPAGRGSPGQKEAAISMPVHRPAWHAEFLALRPPPVMKGLAEVASEEPAPTGRGPAGPSGGSGGSEVQRVPGSASVVWERAGPEEAKATVREDAAPAPGASQPAAAPPPGQMGSHPTGGRPQCCTTLQGLIWAGL